MLRNRPWDLVFLSGFCVYAWTRGVYEKRARINQWRSRATFTGDRWLLALVFVGALGVPMVYLFTPWLAFADVRLPLWTSCLGTVVMGLALWLFWRSHAELGLNWSMHLKVRSGHELVTSGVYTRVRHPMYAAIWAFGLAQGLLLSNWLAGWSAVACFAPLYLVRTPREERFMRDVFGPAYDAYVRRTGRLIPRVNREPQAQA